MAMGRKKPVQQPLFIRTDELSKGPRHRFYEKLNEILEEAGFDAYLEELCASSFAADGSAGRVSTLPGVYFRMLFIGYFEGLESERGICWRVEDSMSLRSFLGIGPLETAPDHSTLSRLRKRFGVSIYEGAFHFMLRVLNEKGLLRGKVAGVDSTYLRADASMKSIVRKGSGEGYKGYLKKLAKAAGIENPTDEDLVRMDRSRPKKMSNTEWESPVDPDSEIMRIKDGRTRLAYKAEHTVDMETGAILAADIYRATAPDSETIKTSVENANENIAHAKRDDDSDDDTGGTGGGIQEVVGDKGYHKASTIKELGDQSVRTYFPERKQRGVRRWAKNGGRETAIAVYKNRSRLKSAKSKALQRKRGELVERSFAHVCETGGQRRTRLRGLENVQKRYLAQVAAFNLSLVMRKVLGRGTPRGLLASFALIQSLTLSMLALVANLFAPLRNIPRQTPNGLPWTSSAEFHPL